MSRISETTNLSYDVIFEQLINGLKRSLSKEITVQKPEFEHSTPNRLRIYLDRNKFSGVHYEICFRQAYYEFALHFESTPARNLERRQFFDPHLEEITNLVGQIVKSGPLENQGRMRVWYEHKREPIDQEKINIFIEHYSRFMIATYPILNKVYSNT